MSPDTLLLIITIGNPVAMVFVGVWLIKFGKRMERPFYVIFGKFVCIAAPIALIAGIGGLVMANLRR